MEGGIKQVEETRERTAKSISDALDFLRVEADAAGLLEVGNLIRLASTKSRDHGASLSPKRRWRRCLQYRYLPLAAAAGVAAMAVVLLLLPPRNYAASYQTAVGGYEEIRLPDDSVITLNTHSAVSVHYSDGARHVHLQRGEAYFDVAPAPERPFIVVAGSGTVRAVGTAFDMYLKDDVVEVTVTEGIVEVLPNALQAAALAPEMLGEGQTLEYRETIEYVADVDEDEIARRLAWRDGMLDFRGATLAEVVEEAGRYISTRIAITTPAIEGLSMNGYIRAGDVDTLLELIESNDGVTVRRIDAFRVQITATTALNP